jgi:hypothetical protein
MIDGCTGKMSQWLEAIGCVNVVLLRVQPVYGLTQALLVHAIPHDSAHANTLKWHTMLLIGPQANTAWLRWSQMPRSLTCARASACAVLAAGAGEAWEHPP